MLSIGWIVLILVVGIILFVAFGMALIDDNVPDSVKSCFFVFGFLSVLSGFIFLSQKGAGQVADPSRLRSDQAYKVVGVVERDDGVNVVMLNDYDNCMFAIVVPDDQLPVVEGNETVSVDRNGFLKKQHFVPFPRLISAEDETKMGSTAKQR